MANYPIYRQVKGSPLTFQEMDGNLEWLSRTMSASIVTITGSTFVLGNLNVSDGITGSLFGTSSWAVSASYTINAISASYVSGSSAIIMNLTSSNDARINGLRIGRGANNQIENTVVGDLAFISNVTGIRNTAVGFEALYYNSIGRFNTAYGWDALYFNSVGEQNVAIGYSALQSNRSGSFNTILGGVNTAYEITSGSWNTILGSNSGRAITIGNNNTIIGGRLNNSFTPGAPFTTTMSDNVILGDGKGYIRYRFDGIQNNFYDNIVVTGSAIFTKQINEYDLLVQNTSLSPYPMTSITVASTLDSNYGTSQLNLNTGTKIHYISTWGAYNVLGLRFNTSNQSTNTDVSTLFAQRYTDRPTQLLLNFNRNVQVVGNITDEWIYIRAQADTNTSKAFRIVATDHVTDKFTVYGDGSTIVSGSLTVISGITGSLFGTSSWSQNSVTASTLNQTSSIGFVSNMSDTYTSTAKITDIITLSAAEYAAIGSPLTSTLYVII